MLFLSTKMERRESVWYRKGFCVFVCKFFFFPGKNAVAAAGGGGGALRWRGVKFFLDEKSFFGLFFGGRGGTTRVKRKKEGGAISRRRPPLPVNPLNNGGFVLKKVRERALFCVCWRFFFSSPLES